MSGVRDLFRVDGLPGALPDGEVVLWQGGPSAGALARHALHDRLIAAYFAAAGVAELAVAWSQGWTPAAAAAAFAVIVASAAVVIGLIRVFAILIARTTRYTITSRRVVMRIGIALPVTLNIPFKIVEGAALRTYEGGTGDIPVAIAGWGRIGFLHLWPHARPWRVGRPEPMLRAVPEAGQVAAILARALGAGPLGQAATARQDTSLSPARRTAPATAA